MNAEIEFWLLKEDGARSNVTCYLLKYPEVHTRRQKVLSVCSPDKGGGLDWWDHQVQYVYD